MHTCYGTTFIYFSNLGQNFKKPLFIPNYLISKTAECHPFLQALQTLAQTLKMQFHLTAIKTVIA